MPLGAYGGVVIEPAGSKYRQPGSNLPLPGGGLGLEADIIKNGLRSREFVALFTDNDRRLGNNEMPYQQAVAGLTAISYSQEPLALRGLATDPANVFNSVLWGDPRHVVTLPAGARLIYRVGFPWGEQEHAPALEGHRFPQEPGMAGSEALGTDVLTAGMTLDWDFLGGAGGDLEAPGDYLFLDLRRAFVEAGQWHIVRVVP